MFNVKHVNAFLKKQQIVESITIPDHNICDNTIKDITAQKAFISRYTYNKIKRFTFNNFDFFQLKL